MKRRNLLIVSTGKADYGLLCPLIQAVAKIDRYARRIVQMGEKPESVFTVGAIGLDNIKDMSLMNSAELSQETGVDFNKKIALTTYHPVTLDNYAEAKQQIREVMSALVESDLISLVTMPNHDTGGNEIFETIIQFENAHPEKFKVVKNLGQRAYLSAMKHAALMVGNSSSGVIEASSFRLPVVNIGDRQGGRYEPANVIDCECEKEAILTAINQASSHDFRESISTLENPYGDGNTAARITKILEKIDFDNTAEILKKGFFDITDSYILTKLSRPQ